MILATERDTRIEIINSGNFLLDGGSMFGRIPKNLWQKKFTPDENNNITLATNILKIMRKDATILVDAGLGTRYTEKERSLLGFDGQLPDTFPGGVDILIATHLHYDHIGGIHDLDVRQAVLVSEQEWQDAQSDDPISRGSYRRIDLEAVARRLQLITPPFEVLPGIEIIATPGHTAGHVAVLIDNEILYPGDLIRTSLQSRLRAKKS